MVFVGEPEAESCGEEADCWGGDPREGGQRRLEGFEGGSSEPKDASAWPLLSAMVFVRSDRSARIRSTNAAASDSSAFVPSIPPSVPPLEVSPASTTLQIISFSGECIDEELPLPSASDSLDAIVDKQGP